MGQVVGYMLTWTTYGSWLQGDERGYVKDGKTCGGNEELREANWTLQKGAAVRLNRREKDIVREAILQEAGQMQQEIYAICVWSNHVHVVVSNIDESAGRVAGRYKKAATQALKRHGFDGDVWTKGYDKRFCFCHKDLQNRIDYVKGHDE